VRVLITLICIIGPIVAWLAFGEHGFIHLYRVGKERQACEQRIEKLSQENQALFDEIQRLRKDPKYVEQVARKELGLVKDNELIYRFQEDEKSEAGKTDKSGETASRKGEK
jgi:cell division protein FtsB